MTGLRECPFCGSKDVYQDGDLFVSCNACVSDGPMVSYPVRDNGKNGEAARLWNNRSYDGLVGELVEAGKGLYGAHWQTWCGDPHTTPEQMAEDEAHFATFDEVKRWEAALTRAKEAGYGEKQAEPSSPPTQSAE